MNHDVFDELPLDPRGSPPQMNHDVFDEFALDPRSPFPQVSRDVFDELPSTLGALPRR